MSSGPRVQSKWRPPLSWIVLAVLLVVLALPVAVVVGFRALDGTVSQMGFVEFVALAVALVLTLVIGLVFSRTLTGPINALIARTEAIGRGGRRAIEAPAQHGTREVAVLSQSFLDLATRLVERTEYVSSFAVHVAHELKSPVTSIRGSAELLLDGDMAEADRRRFLEHIITDADRLAALLDRLRELARTDQPVPTKGANFEAALAELAPSYPGLTLTKQGEAGLTVAFSPEALAIVLGQLADNSARHGAQRLGLSVCRSGSFALVEVSDDGPGILPGNRDKVFEPFFTTRRETGGTGMGLQIARSMLEAHGGSIRLLPGEGGATFELTIPLQP